MNPGDCNKDGECIVTYARNPAFPRDHVFVGKPTPEMEPLDEEAEKITESMRDGWIHPIESLPSHDNLSAIPARSPRRA